METGILFLQNLRKTYGNKTAVNIAALESIVTGLQLSLGYSWRALIGAELIAASAGIGYLILDAEEMSRPDIVLAGMLCIGIIGSILDWAFLHILQRLIPWYQKK